MTDTIAREARERMVSQQIAARGITDERVLAAMRDVPREAFVPPDLEEFAYADAPLPIGEEQTISQPYVVALMCEALALPPGARLLEIGAGSGYAAAVLGRMAERVITLERHASLAEQARQRLASLGYHNVEVQHADGRLGWPPAAPYHGIVATAAGADVPQPLLEQLEVGGRLVIPVGELELGQSLRLIIRHGADDYEELDLGAVQFVPLLPGLGRSASPKGDGDLPTLVRGAAQPVEGVDDADLAPLVDRIGDARLVLIGEASHGTSEFYRMRQRITRELIERRGFAFVAAEADWPDASLIDAYVRRGPEAPDRPRQAFSRFPTWMWRNVEVLEFVEWLRGHNDEAAARGVARAAFYGLDLYSLYASVGEVLAYLDEVDPEAARIARQRYGCLGPFESDPGTYGLAALTDAYRSCEEEVVRNLTELQGRRGAYVTGAGERFFDAEQNARVAANAERYYRAMYYGSVESWNLRDTHMFETLEAILTFHGPDARGVVWAHNSHLGDARATEMARRNELNLGQLVRERFDNEARLVGFGTDHGTVAAADGWDEPMRVMSVRPSHERSYERVCHDSGVAAFVLPLRDGETEASARQALSRPRLERAIGVIYRPETELASHYFSAELPSQFDEYVWFDETSAITPLAGAERTPPLAEAHPLATID